MQAGKRQGQARTEWCDGVQASQAKVFWNSMLTSRLRTTETDCKYFQGGIYFSMTVRMKLQKEVFNDFFGAWEWKKYEGRLEADYPYFLKKKCSQIICRPDGNTLNPYGDRFSETFYSSINKLSDIELTIRFFVNTGDYGSFSSPLLSINTHQSTVLQDKCD